MIDTEIIELNKYFAPEQIIKAAQALKSGELVAFPTETVYGLGANAFLAHAVQKIFEVKGRPQDNPLIVHLHNPAQLSEVAKNIPQITYLILNEFAPGPLTIILEKTDKIPAQVSAGLDTVAIRFPNNDVARTLLSLAEVPVVAPSANLSGKPSPTKAWHVYQDLQGKIPYILDGGTCTYGLESTILDLSVDQPVILRPGIITAKDIKQRAGIEVIEPERLDQNLKHPKAPGQKYRHYSPMAPVVILQEESNLEKRIGNLKHGIRDFVKNYDSDQKDLRIGLFLAEDLVNSFDLEKLTKSLNASTCYKLHFQIESYNNDQGADNAARELYNQFRVFDQQKVDLIICSAEPNLGAGIAYMNRLSKAASYNI